MAETALKTKGVEAVDKALHILSLFTADTPKLSLGEISQRSGYVKSTAMRLLISLQQAGLVVMQPDKSYMVGPQTFRLGHLYQRSLRLEPVVRPVLRALVLRTGESGSFFKREGNMRVCLFREDSSQVLREHVPEGEAVGLDKGAPGHVLSEFSDVDGTRPASDAQLARLPIVSLGQRGPDIAGIAAPVFGAAQGLVGAVTLSGPRTRFTPEVIEDMRPLVLEAARELTRALAGSFYDDLSVRVPRLDHVG
ncbi:IclR family transcriptional regulator [Ancylobacter sp. MQZ15Z-1]|uniref:IclR family transcriptional regulator n=1 Tax=Ancylobacter mangrovi TaxID=2972472 RepID=A0A9X2T656_9HYPH|nr:IclR family transcriptional regulator [Ancylobacter mangrovi]MCS0494573.1 IclR family transcriptional regulator [Ancylobacter mangrovi]